MAQATAADFTAAIEEMDAVVAALPVVEQAQVAACLRVLEGLKSGVGSAYAYALFIEHARACRDGLQFAAARH